MQTASN